MAGAGQGDQRIPQASHRRRRMSGGRERTADQNHRRSDEENQGYGGIKMKDGFISKIGVYGQIHYRYLKENKPSVVNVMRMKGKLRSYLEEVDVNAEEMLFQLIKQMAKNEDVTESLKRQDQMAWVQRMNSIRDRAFEIVSKEIICN